MDACIENYPDKNVPTILVYHEGKSQVPIIGLSELGGTRVDAKSECVRGGWGCPSPDLLRMRPPRPAPSRPVARLPVLCTCEECASLSVRVLCVPRLGVELGVPPLPPTPTTIARLFQ